jgi:hypothetical protein
MRFVGEATILFPDHHQLVFGRLSGTDRPPHAEHRSPERTHPLFLDCCLASDRLPTSLQPAGVIDRGMLRDGDGGAEQQGHDYEGT